MRPYADNVVVELEPLETISSGGIHLVAHCTRCDGRGSIRDHGAVSQCKQCGGSGVSDKISRGSRFGRVIASGLGYRRPKNAGANGTYPSVFVPNETRAGDRVVLDAQAGQVWDG